ncbi:hypothetical protein KA005_11985, partial [bacterium]|nr:hypothetical protein [bacterium]
LNAILPEFTTNDALTKEMDLQPAGFFNISTVADGEIIIDGDSSDWPSLALAFTDLINDENENADFVGMDIHRFYLAKDSTYLYIGMELYDGDPKTDLGAMYVFQANNSYDDADTEGDRWTCVSFSNGFWKVDVLERGWQYENIFTQTATITVDGSVDDWAGLTPAASDPQGDSTGGSGGDIKHVYTAIDSTYAYVMVETHNIPINATANVELNFNYKPGQHFTSARFDDLHTNIGYSTIYAWNDNDLDGSMESYPISGYTVARGDVLEARIPLAQIENASYFNPTFVNIWASGASNGDDPTTIPSIGTSSTLINSYTSDYAAVDSKFIEWRVPLSDMGELSGKFIRAYSHVCGDVYPPTNPVSDENITRIMLDTASISGTVTCDAYTSGNIFILAYDGPDPDIANLLGSIIANPDGTFTLAGIPIGSDVYLVALF